MTRTDRAAAKRVTRADVARYAGVSSAVVSYVVNDGPKPVAEATAQRVRDAIEVLGYRPNSTARALKVGSTQTLGLVVPDSSNPFFAEYALATQRATADRGYALLIANTSSDTELELRYALDLSDREIDGLMVARAGPATRIAELAQRAAAAPVVMIDSPTPVPGMRTVGTDSAAGSSELVQHLIGVHGHRSVALMIGSITDAVTDGRERGWTEGHARVGRQPGPVRRGEFTREGGYLLGRQMLQDSPRPTAVLAGSDLLAIGLLRAAHELGVDVPGDLAVVSFDGTAESEYCWPPLTTARQRVGEMAQAAVEAVLTPRREPYPQHQLFATDLIVRRSCGCDASWAQR